jgi:molecular chaperone IbpA
MMPEKAFRYLTGFGNKHASETYLHRGIARRAFKRWFSLADHMKVTSANIDNGMLHVDLVHEVPEAAKPRTIKIGTSAEPRPQVTEQKAA